MLSSPAAQGPVFQAPPPSKDGLVSKPPSAWPLSASQALALVLFHWSETPASAAACALMWINLLDRRLGLRFDLSLSTSVPQTTSISQFPFS